MKTWFSIQAKAANKAAPIEVNIFDYIGYYGVTARDFIMSMKRALTESESKEIVVSINSPGGSVFDAVAIYNALRNAGAKITVRVLGIAASAASLIAMAGDKIKMPENTMMMVHNPLNGIYGNADEMREMADILDKVGASLVSTYVARTGRTEDEVKALLKAETYMTAIEAKEHGFADEVEPALAVTAAFELDRLPENVRAVFQAAAKSQETKDDVVDPDEAIEVIETSATFAAQLNALANTAGMKEYVAIWLMDAAITNIDQAKTAINQAVEVRALCEFANCADMAKEFINKGTSLADARAQILKARADAVDSQGVDSIQPSAGKKPPVTAPQAAFKTADIWAARRKH